MDKEDQFMSLADAMQIVLDLANIQHGRAEQRARHTIAQLGKEVTLTVIFAVEDFAVNQLGND